MRGALLWSGLSGLGVALVALLVTRLTAFSIEDPANGLSLSMHAAGADMFFGTWALIGLLVVVFVESGVLFPILPGDSLRPPSACAYSMLWAV